MSNMENATKADVHARELKDLLSEDEVVVSGIAGRFPESENVQQLQDNLMSKRDLVTEDNRRWNLGKVHVSQY